LRWRESCMDVENQSHRSCVLWWPTKVDTKSRSLPHLWNGFLDCSFASRTYVGQPKCCQCLGLEATLVFTNISIGEWWCLSFTLGVMLFASFAIRITYGHRLADISWGHLLLAWINIVHAISCNCWMRASAWPFWWWAFTPANFGSTV
jgi:hypothetical protein